MTDLVLQQFGRAYSLMVTNPGNVVSLDGDPNNLTGSQTQALDLSALHFKFRTFAPDAQTPNHAVITVYNVAPNTIQQIQNEFTNVILQAGYQNGDYGQIFTGAIKWLRKGRENNKDTFIELFCADGDDAYNFATINQTLARNSSDPQSVANAIGTSFTQFGTQQADTTGFNGSAGGILPRGKVLFGMARAAARNHAKTNGMTWSIQNGTLVWTPLDGYADGEAVVLTSQTGLIGVPEQTQNGILIRCLINPKIQVGGLVKIDNASLNTTDTTIGNGGQPNTYPSYSSFGFFASTSADGSYKVLCNEMVGDTRGNDWYCDLTCIAVDVSSGTVKPFVGG